MSRPSCLAMSRTARAAVASCAAFSALALGSCRVWDVLFSRQDAQDSSRVLWHVEGYSNYGRPWFDNSAAYFQGPHHQVTAVEKGTGGVLWSVLLPVQREFSVGFGGFERDGMLIVGDQDLFALDPRDGHVIWRFASTEGVDIGRDNPEYWNGTVYAGSSNGYAYGVDLITGTQRWVTRLSTSSKFGLWISPIVDGTLYVGTTDFDNGLRGGVAALDALSGQLLWASSLPWNVDSTAPTATIDPVVVGSVVVAGARDGPLYAFDRLTGALRWKAPALPVSGGTTPALIRDVRVLAVSGSLVLAGSTSGVLVALDPETGAERWRASMLAGGSISWLSADDSSAYAVMPYAGIQVFSTSSGATRWHLDADYHFINAVAIDSDRIYGGSHDSIAAYRK